MRILFANKKSWIRIAEAAIAIMILSSVIIVLIAKQAEKHDIGEDIYKLQQLILQEAAKNESVRAAVLNYPNNFGIIENFVGTRMPAAIGFNITVCNPTGACNTETPTVNKDVYVNDILISSTLTQYQPKKLRIVSWISSGETVRKSYGAGVINSVVIYYFEWISGTMVTDSSGNGLYGTLVGSPLPQQVPGKEGYGLQFDGNNYVEMALPEIRNAITIEAWIKPDSINPGDAIIIKPNTSDSDPRIYGLEVGNNNNIVFFVTIHGIKRTVESAANLQTGVWTYVAGTFDGSRLRVYISDINGITAAERSVTGSIDASSMPVWIAKGRISSMANSFDGTVDTARIYSKALTSSEISQHYMD